MPRSVQAGCPPPAPGWGPPAGRGLGHRRDRWRMGEHPHPSPGASWGPQAGPGGSAPVLTLRGPNLPHRVRAPETTLRLHGGGWLSGVSAPRHHASTRTWPRPARWSDESTVPPTRHRPGTLLRHRTERSLHGAWAQSRTLPGQSQEVMAEREVMEAAGWTRWHTLPWGPALRLRSLLAAFSLLSQHVPDLSSLSCLLLYQM